MEPTPEQQLNAADERACGEHITYWLDKLGCVMIPIIELRAGQVIARIDIQKIPPQILKQMKKQKKNGQSGSPATSS